MSNRYEGPCEVLSRGKDIHTIKNINSEKVLTRHASHLEQYFCRQDGSAGIDLPDDIEGDSP